jgi:hypothetical protein
VRSWMTLHDIGHVKQIFKVAIARMLERSERSPDEESGRTSEPTFLFETHSSWRFSDQHVAGPGVPIDGSRELPPRFQRSAAGAAGNVTLQVSQA